ncbi:Pre-mRNA splicing factor PRP21 like protein-domain-containing protein [Phlyctochytrium arcticum]|nr:Pre-mRNA splicing factor PRP21 like protein-domain-containing protein [Phlyctochytrium arcticum]
MTRTIPKPPPGVKVRTNYVSKVRHPRVKQISQVCPRCKRAVPASEMAEHVRIELLDPKWKEQRAKARDKNKESNLESDTVSSNLKALASTRPDIFGGDEYSIEKSLKEQQAADAAAKKKVIWDGHTASIGTVTQKLGASTNWDEQMEEIRKEAEEAAHRANAIGPRVPHADNSHYTSFPLPPIPPPQSFPGPSASAPYSHAYPPGPDPYASYGYEGNYAPDPNAYYHQFQGQ